MMNLQPTIANSAPPNLPTPTVGTRFTTYGQEYEITRCVNGYVRYASNAGGKAFQIPMERFKNGVQSGGIQISFAPSAFCATAGDLEAATRRLRYVESATAQLKHPQSHCGLRRVIAQVAAAICDMNPPTPRSVCRWISTELQTHSLRDLMDKDKHKGNYTLRFDPFIEQLYLEAVETIYLTPESRTANDVRDYIVGKLIEARHATISSSSITIPSLRSIQRRLASLDQYVVTRARKGEIAAQRYARAAGRSLKSAITMSLVQIDNHMLDCIVVDEDTREPIGRPWIVCIFDVRTRMVVGFYISLFPPSAVSSLGALKDMIIHYGIPHRIIPDNGVDFRNTAFMRLCQALLIVICPAQSYDPNGKAHLERFFRTMTKAIIQKIAGTTFSSPEERASYDSQAKASFTLDELREIVSKWIHDVYHITIHSETGRAPLLYFGDTTKETLSTKISEADINVIARTPHSRTIYSGRVVVDHIEYFSHSLTQWNGLAVTVMVDELDLDYVFIVDPTDEKNVIRADSVDPAYTKGLTSHAHQECLKIKMEFSTQDSQRLGKLAAAHARYLLMQRVHDLTKLGKRLKRKIKQGKSAANMSTTPLPLPPSHVELEVISPPTYQETEIVRLTPLSAEANNKSFRVLEI